MRRPRRSRKGAARPRRRARAAHGGAAARGAAAGEGAGRGPPATAAATGAGESGPDCSSGSPILPFSATSVWAYGAADICTPDALSCEEL